MHSRPIWQNLRLLSAHSNLSSGGRADTHFVRRGREAHWVLGGRLHSGGREGRNRRQLRERRVALNYICTHKYRQRRTDGEGACFSLSLRRELCVMAGRRKGRGKEKAVAGGGEYLWALEMRERKRGEGGNIGTKEKGKVEERWGEGTSTSLYRSWRLSTGVFYHIIKRMGGDV